MMTTKSPEKADGKPISNPAADDEETDSSSSTTNEEQIVAEGDDEQETSSDPEDGDKGTSLKKPMMPLSMLRKPPKMRIKLSLRKLPTLANRKGGLPKSGAAPEEDSDNGEVKATVVDSDDAGESEAVAAVVASTGNEQAPPNSNAGSNTKPTAKRRTPNPSRPIRMPPIASPGLMMALPANAPKSEQKSGYVTPASVFDHNMEAAGYTKDSRSKRPHRGSSVKREVGDMFDSNVTLSLRFPSFVPEDLLRERAIVEGEEKSLPQLLIESLTKQTKSVEESGVANGTDYPSRKRTRPWSFTDMAPVSLSLPYPQDFVAKRAQYVNDVESRERAIVASQEAEETADVSNEQPTDPDRNGRTNSSIFIPSIPDPPPAPSIKDFSGIDPEKFEDRHPLYPPRGKETFVSHLDEKCFHSSEGRYFGLMTNWIADPNFVGPNAPGMSGLTASGGSGLATSTSGGGISGAMALTLSTTYNGTTAGAAAALKSATTSVVDTPKKGTAPKERLEVPKNVGPKATGTVSDLKKIMDEEGDLAVSIKDCIIRAAVHASRSGRHGQSFLAPNGEIYPDVSKAFASHAGIKPCNRCKSNKQGAYHCRLRRRHKELDYDGGNTAGILAPLFSAQMDSLLSRSSGS